MQHLAPHTHHPVQHLLHPSDYYMPGHGLGAHKGADRYADHTVAMFRSGFLFSLLLTLPVVLDEPLFRNWLGYQVPTFAGIDLIPIIFGTAVFFYGGQIFIRCAYRELRERQPGMMLLITVAITMLFLYSVVITLGAPGQALWQELVTLMTLLLLCNWIIMRSIIHSQGVLNELTRRLPDTALRLDTADQATEVALTELQQGDQLLICPGTTIPADGVVKQGQGTIDESLLGGAMQPVHKEIGDRVVAGTINGQGTLHITLTGRADQPALRRITKLLEAARNTHSATQAQVDRVALTLTIAVIAVAVFTLLGWLWVGASLDFTITHMVTVLVIAAPHTLGLAVPLVIANAMARGADRGMLVCNRRGLEKAKNLDIVVFDKRGILTTGEYHLYDTVTIRGLPPHEALRLAAAVESNAHHPIAQAICASAQTLEVPLATDFQVHSELGEQATVDGRTLMVGGAAMLRQWNIPLPDELRAATERFTKLGQTVGYLLEQQRPLAAFAVADPVRPESPAAISMLHHLGIEVAMLTDESQTVAHHFAHELGIDSVFAQLRHGDKREAIRELKGYGKRVAFVGNNTKETKALTVADIGIVSGVGTELAVEGCDVALIRSDPCDVAHLITLSKLTYHKVVENIGLAVLYNIIALALAAGVLTESGVLLSPVIGVLLMTMSVLVVTFNAQQLRRSNL